jgi:hypothetical protein
VTDYPSWRQALAKANDPAFWPITAIDELISSGHAQFWATDKAAIVTHVVTYPGGAVAVEAIAGAGSQKDMIESIGPAVETWARSIGATHLKVAGRAGWSRQMKPHGWRHYQDIIVKGLSDGQ